MLTPPPALPAPARSTAKPVGNRLFFGGEHTRADYPGTVQGAYFSGVDAACAVLKAAGKKC